MQDNDPNSFQFDEPKTPDLGDPQVPAKDEFTNPDGTVSSVIGGEDPRTPLSVTDKPEVEQTFSGVVQPDAEGNLTAAYPGLPTELGPEVSSYQTNDGEQGGDVSAIDLPRNDTPDESPQSELAPAEQAFNTGVIGGQDQALSTEAGPTPAYPEFASDAPTESINLPNPEDPQQPEQ